MEDMMMLFLSPRFLLQYNDNENNFKSFHASFVKL